VAFNTLGVSQKYFFPCFATLLLGLSGATALWLASQFTFFRSPVANVSNSHLFAQENFPGLVWQSADAPDLRRFRALVPDRLRSDTPSLRLGVGLCHWVWMQQPPGKSWIPVENTLLDRLRGDSENPLTLIEEQHRGLTATCRRFSYVLVGAAASVGMKSRVVIVDESFYKGHHPSHVMSELWIPELHKWVLMDAMWDNVYLVDSNPASALDIYNAVHANRVGHVSVLHAGVFAPIEKIQDLKREFANLYIPLTNAVFDGYEVCFHCAKEISFVHLRTPQSTPYPVGVKGFLKGFGALCLTASFGTAMHMAAGILWLRKRVLREQTKHLPAAA
jgi:hypothetical protein